MKIISQISENEVIAEFLKAELNSNRFRDRVLSTLDGLDIGIINKPDLSDATENQIRKKVLGEFRGYGLNKGLFENFPVDIVWYKASFEKNELYNVMYIDYSYWNELSNNTRLPINARLNIHNDIRVFETSNQGFFDISLAIKEGKSFPRLIFVSRNKHARIVVLEGHARLTGYFLYPDYLPETLEVIIGFSEGFKDWDLY